MLNERHTSSEVYTAAEHISIYRCELPAGGEILKTREKGAEVEDEEEADIKGKKKRVKVCCLISVPFKSCSESALKTK